MQRPVVVFALSVLITALAVLTSVAGLVDGDGEESTVTSVRGEVVELYGEGLYKHDSQFIGSGNRGLNVVTVTLGIPLLALSALLYVRGSTRGQLLLIGSLGYFLYAYASLALGTAYNELFLAYIATFSASFFAFVVCVASIDLDVLAAGRSPRMPCRRIGGFMLASGVVTLVVWLGPLIDALATDAAPDRLDHYTVTVTDVLDLGVIMPSALLAGFLLLRREALGVVLASALLVLEVLLAPLIGAQTLFQVQAGVDFETGELVGPMAGFVTLSVLATWVLVTLLRSVSKER